MDDNIKQIGERLRGLREVLDIPAEEVAELCELPLEQYLKMERGEADPSVGSLALISRRYGIALDVLLFGEEPRMSGYFITRKNQGPSVERRKEYKYQSLASGFRRRKVNVFLTQVDPLPAGGAYRNNTHDGQEFNYVVEGRMEITIGEKTMTLAEGDSIYFDSSLPHNMKALDGKPVKFIVVVV